MYLKYWDMYEFELLKYWDMYELDLLNILKHRDMYDLELRTLNFMREGSINLYL